LGHYWDSIYVYGPTRDVVVGYGSSELEDILILNFAAVLDDPRFEALYNQSEQEITVTRE